MIIKLVEGMILTRSDRKMEIEILRFLPILPHVSWTARSTRWVCCLISLLQAFRGGNCTRSATIPIWTSATAFQMYQRRDEERKRRSHIIQKDTMYDPSPGFEHRSPENREKLNQLTRRRKSTLIPMNEVFWAIGTLRAWSLLSNTQFVDTIHRRKERVQSHSIQHSEYVDLSSSLGIHTKNHILFFSASTPFSPLPSEKKQWIKKN